MHRDISTRNIFLKKQIANGIEILVPKIGDFGFSVQLNDVENMTQIYRNTRVGTRGYMAPEILDNQPYNYQTDIFSIGVIAFKMLYNDFPLEGKTTDEIKANLKNGKLLFV